VIYKDVFEVKDRGWVDASLPPGIGVEIDEAIVPKVASKSQLYEK